MRTTVMVAAALAAGLSTLVGCGGDDKHVTAPPAPSASAEPVASAAPSAAPAASSAAPVASAKPVEPPPPAPKASFAGATKNASSGKVDKVGAGDGAFKGDGVKDLVIDVEFDGAATAFLLVSTDAQGMPNGEFTADTFVGTQSLPAEVGSNLNQGKFTAGLAVYEGDKLLNGKDGALPAVAEGKHKLSLYVSSKDAPQTGNYKVIALLPEKVTVSSPVIAFGDGKPAAKPDAKPAAKPAGSAAPAAPKK